MSARRGCRLAGGEFFAQGGENLCIGLGYVGGERGGYIGLGMGGLVGGLGDDGSMEPVEGRIINPFYPPTSAHHPRQMTQTSVQAFSHACQGFQSKTF